MAEVKIEPRRTRRGRFSAFVKDSKGATAVEFALVAAPFLGLLAAIMQSFLLFFAQGILENVVRQTGRTIMTGQVQSAQMTQSQFKTQVCNQAAILFTCNGVMVDVQVANSWTAANAGAPTLTFNAQGQNTNTWQFNPGNEGDVVVVRVMYLWPSFFGSLGLGSGTYPGGTVLVMASAAFQNEPATP